MSKIEDAKQICQQYFTPTRAVITVIILIALGVWGPNSVTYLTTAGRILSEKVRSNVPLDFELERAKTMIGDMLPDIRKNMILIAEEEVGVEQIRRDVQESESSLEEQRTQLLTLRNDLSNRDRTFVVGSRAATPAEVQDELARRFTRYQTAETTVEAKRQLLRAREASLSAARQKLDQMLNTKRDLEVEVENLTARLRTLDHKSSTPQIEFDEHRLAKCQQLVDELRVRLEVADRLLAARGNLEDVVTASYVPSHGDIALQIDQYFDSASNN
jgi:chromosome segregation ATPase